MRTIVACLLLASLSLVLGAPAFGQSVASNSPRIVEVLADPAAGNREFIEILNPATQAISLQGWKMKDAPTTSGSVNTFTFPAWTLAPQSRVVVWGGSPADGAGPSWSATSAWNNAGDVATLVDASGNVVDVFAYGSATYRPAGWENLPTVPAADKGSSLAWHATGWTAGEPTPGRDDAAPGGVLQVTVANLPPAAALSTPGNNVAVRAGVSITVTANDGNGADDVASWSLADAATLASGTTGGTQTVVAVAPAAPGSWTLTLTVTDKAGLEATTQLTLQVQPSGLRVEIPAVPGSLVLAAGASSSASGVVATITNDGAAPAKVRVDLGPLSGAAARAPDGILEVGWTVAGNTTWTPYHGAWMPVADLASHAAATLAFRLTADGLPAGTYGTSFSVVAT